MKHARNFSVDYCNNRPVDVTDELEIKKFKMIIALAERAELVRTIVDSFESRLNEFKSRLKKDHL